MIIRTTHMRIRIDLFMLMLLPLSLILGSGQYTGLLMISLITHESAHILAAHALHVRISELRISPLGASARIENPYSCSASRLCITAAAGPAASLLLMLTGASFSHWNILSPQLLVELIQINALLLIFNLLPALPLDGGRIAYALLTRILPRRKALSICIFSGYILSGLMIFMCIRQWFLSRTLPLPLIMAAMFLIVSVSDEKNAYAQTCADALLSELQPLSRPLPVAMIAVDESTPPLQALQAAVPGKRTLYAVFNAGRFHHVADSNELLELRAQKT